MTAAAPPEPTTAPSKPARITGWILSILPCLLLLMSATMKFLKPPEVVKGTLELGWPEHLLLPLGIVELTCTLLFLFPRTAVLGAILLTGYLGGAAATHVRLGQPFIIPILAGALLWLGLLLRKPHLRKLLPLTK